jgi:hypothetical protein
MTKPIDLVAGAGTRRLASAFDRVCLQTSIDIRGRFL